MYIHLYTHVCVHSFVRAFVHRLTEGQLKLPSQISGPKDHSARTFKIPFPTCALKETGMAALDARHKFSCKQNLPTPLVLQEARQPEDSVYYPGGQKQLVKELNLRLCKLLGHCWNDTP